MRTMSASGSMSMSRPGYTERIGPPRTPPIPASAAPRQNTSVNKRGTAIPSPRAISMSSTPARIIAPTRVRSRATQRIASTTTENPTTARRYLGKKIDPNRTPPARASGMGSGIGSPDQTRSDASPMMKAMPSVMRTWESNRPASLRKRNRSRSAPRMAMASPPMTTAAKKPSPARSAESPTYAPSMKKAPWARFATRMRPKMSENPEESRKSSPPSARPFSDWMRKKRTGTGLLLQVLRLREGAGVRRALEELLRLVLPELAHVRVGLDHAVDEAAVLPLDFADVDGEDGIAVLVDPDGAPEALLDVEGSQRLHEGFLVLDVSLHLLQGEIEEESGRVRAGAVVAHVLVVLLAELGDELLVLGSLDGGAVPPGGDDRGGLVAHVLQDSLVHGGHVPQHRDLPLEAVLRVLAQEAKAVGAGEARVDGVHVGLEVADVGAVVGDVEGRPELLHDLPAILLEGALEARGGLVAEGEVVADGGDALVLEHLRRVFAERVVHLRGGAHGAHEPGVQVALREILRCRGRRDYRHLRLLDVVVDGERFEGGERSDDRLHLVALDGLLRPGLGGGGLTGRVERRHLDLPSGEHSLVLIEVEGEPFLHLPAAGGAGAGLQGEEADADGPLVGGGGGSEHGEGDAAAAEDCEEPSRAARPAGCDGVGHLRDLRRRLRCQRQRRKVDVIYHEGYTVN